MKNLTPSVLSNAKKFYSPKEVSALLDVKLPTIRRWMALRKLSFVRVGGRLARIPESEIIRLTSNVIPARPSEAR